MRSKTLLLFLLLLVLVLDPGMADAGNIILSPDDGTGYKKTSREVREEESSSEKSAVYSSKKGECRVIWVVEISGEDQEEKIRLRTRQPFEGNCTLPFVDQLPLHRRLFKKIFANWDKERFDTLFTGPLVRLEPAHTWNIRIAMAAAESTDWQEWTRNYPHQASGKSSNEIYVELANRADAYQELAALFAEFGLRLRLDSVEKTFAQQAEEFPFARELKARGITGNPRLTYDAGMHYFSLSPLH